MSNKPYKRNERLACRLLDMVRKEVWMIHGNICNITYVTLSKDFKYSDVYLQTEDENNIKLLQDSEKEIMRQVRSNWSAKYMPTLRFHIDKKANHMDKMRAIMESEDF
ncbi:ribosome-binding factor A [Candidatus Cytomitobacter indipagum]|uniref:Ribosome-binding factor A n=1 Tax=Candidatus Cytomitobacter indipagum TaxID=2601575 RepID=A0A5C0UEQ8_9PROT|nr:ribosome-binding factor A [Candidatus Cytomitobacter indipagum]QEK38171.1 ribosome-binding factor A [Candidatus Cytomitobacter indipagum]